MATKEFIMKHSKIAIIGAGSVGSTTAYALLLKGIVAEIMVVDIDATLNMSFNEVAEVTSGTRFRPA